MTILALAAGCDDPKCPPGYFQKGDTCYRCRPVGGANSAACVVGDAAVLRAEDDDAGSDSGTDSVSSGMDGAAPDGATASDDGASSQNDGAAASDAGTNSANGGSEGDARAGDSGSATGGSDDAATPSNCPAGTADSGTTCQVDPCNPSPCGSGFTCNRTPSGTASCVASCASSELGCQPGDACSTDAECRSGGDSNASCEATGKVCVTVCPTTSIVSPLNVDAARYCREIDGDLIVSPNFATLAADALPYLSRVRGRFNADPSGAFNTSAQSLTFGALQTIDRDLALGLFQNLTLLSFPRLTSVGGNLNIVLAQSLEHLSLPQLTTVQGGVQIGSMPISQLDLARLQTVGGTLTIGGVCYLPWSQISGLASVTAISSSFANIGCCTGQTTRHSCDGACMCN